MQSEQTCRPSLGVGLGLNAQISFRKKEEDYEWTRVGTGTPTIGPVI